MGKVLQLRDAQKHPGVNADCLVILGACCRAATPREGMNADGEAIEETLANWFERYFGPFRVRFDFDLDRSHEICNCVDNI